MVKVRLCVCSPGFVLWAGSIYEKCLLTILLTLVSLTWQCFTMVTHLPLLLLWHWIERSFWQVQTFTRQLRTLLFICCTQKVLLHFLVRVLVKYVLPHVDCRCNPTEDWTPSIWIEQAGEAVIWLQETHCKHHVKSVPWTATFRFRKSSVSSLNCTELWFKCLSLLAFNIRLLIPYLRLRIIFTIMFDSDCLVHLQEWIE